jgi:hypothetical protein
MLYKSIRVFIIALLAAPLLAHAAIELHISESKKEAVQIEVAQRAPSSACRLTNSEIFVDELGMERVSENVFLQKLNSEVGEDAVYLRAARMGGGIYIHLPYFIPDGGCQDIEFKVSAPRILWDGKWYSEYVFFSAAAAQGKSIFFTSEVTPVIKSTTYFDSSIPAGTLRRLEEAFDRIIISFQDQFSVNPTEGVGTVVAIVRNQGKYSGFGGDALNIIRMSYDNPTAENMLSLDRIFPTTFAHELAHKLQSEKLFELPHARYIVEGSADFLKLVVLHGAGLMSDEQTKILVRKAATDCAQFADERTLDEKVAKGGMRFREPYDCGMVYYFVSYYSSSLNGPEFIATLRQALSGQRYSNKQHSLCLLFESNCRNKRLLGVRGDKTHILQQIAWLEGQVKNRPLLLRRPSKLGQ